MCSVFTVTPSGLGFLALDSISQMSLLVSMSLLFSGVGLLSGVCTRGCLTQVWGWGIGTGVVSPWPGIKPELFLSGSLGSGPPWSGLMYPLPALPPGGGWPGHADSWVPGAKVQGTQNSQLGDFHPGR